MSASRSHWPIGAAVAAATGLAGGLAAGAVSVHRWRRRPDPAGNEDFREPPGTAHHRLAACDGGKVHVVERGQGRPMVLVHGVTESTLVWHYQLLDLVEAGHHVLSMDIRGHGRSEAGTSGHSLAAMADDLLQVLQSFDLQGAVLVGHSMGGMIILQLLAEYPELAREGVVSSIALVATSASPILGNGVPVAAAELVRFLTPAASQGHVRASAGRLDRRRPPGDLAAAYCRLAFGSKAWPTHVELLRAMTSAVPPAVVAELIQTLLDLDVRPLLPTIGVPAMVVVGNRDLLTPVWHSRYLLDHLPVAELHVLPGCGHMVPFERRAELADLLVGLATRTQGELRP